MAPEERIGEQSRAAGPVDTVLVVDDEPDIADALKTLLERSIPNVRCVVALNGYEALDRLSAEAIDLLLTDYRMPKMNGVDLLAAAFHVRPSLPRVLVTAYPDLEVAMRAVNQGRIDHIMLKPLDSLELVHVVRELLSEERARSARQTLLAETLAGLRTRHIDPDFGSIPPTPRGI